MTATQKRSPVACPPGPPPPGFVDQDRKTHLLRSNNGGSGHLAGVYDGLPSDAGEDKNWPEPPNPPGLPDADTLPADVLTSALRDHALPVSNAMQVPQDVPCLLSLTCVSAALAGSVEIEVRPGWREPVGIYVAVVLPPSSRKSPCFDAMSAPVRRWESERIRDCAHKVAEALDMVAVRERALDAAIRDAATGKKTEHDVVEARVRLSAAQAAVPHDGRLLAGDITPEKMVARMAAQDGRLAILEPEPGPLQVLAGRYSDSPRLDDLKKAYSAESIIVDRMNRDSLRVERPALTLALMLQPGVIEALPHIAAFRYEGALARFLWCVPPHGLGRRLTGSAVPVLDEAAAMEYDRVLRKFLNLEPAKASDDGTIPSHVLKLDPEAVAILDDFEAEVELKLAEGEDFEEIQDWAGKMVGEAVRVAALLAVSRRAEEGGALFVALDGNSMTGAVRMLRALSSHALQLLVNRDNSRIADLHYLLRRLADLPKKVTENELRTATRGRASIHADTRIVSELLDELENCNCVRRVMKPPTGAPDRPSSPAVELHPELRQEREEVEL